MDDNSRIKLSISPPTAAPQRDKCIICQQKGSTSKKLYGGELGRKRVREVAALKNDVVHKRLKLLEDNAEFKYHNTYACYKSYTDTRYLPTNQEGTNTEQTEKLDKTAQGPSTRSSVTPRPGPSTNNDPDYLNCVICGSDRVWLKRKGTQMRNKFRICSAETAKQFLEAMWERKDDVFVRCADLKDPDDIYAADLYCHNICFKQYVTKSDTKENPRDYEVSPKYDIFKNVMSEIGPFIEDGYGFTMTEIREMMMTKDETLELYNRDVKKYLIDFYGDKIQFCPSHKVNEPELCFSADITVEELAQKLRCQNVVRSAGEILRESLEKVNFNLDDSFCDGNELKDSWENTPIPDQLMTFFSALFGIKRSRLINNEMLNVPNDDHDCDTESEDQVDADEEWAVKNQHNQLNCLFQIIYNQLHHGSKRTPLTVAFGQYLYGKNRSREILTVANHMGVCSSYNDVKRSRRLLASYGIAKSSGGEVPLPSTFTPNCFTLGALDNGDFSDRSSLSGAESSHITMQVLYQEAISPPISKPKVSDMNLKRSSLHLPDKLPCQVVLHHPKPPVKPTLPSTFRLAEETGVTSELNYSTTLCKADKREFLISFLRNGLKCDSASDTMPTWGGCHALLSTATVPLMRVGFMPVIPSPVTDYATVRKSLQNYQSVRRQLNPSQSLMPVACDEGVYHTVADIMMAEPQEFSDIHGMMGMFHWVKILLKCAGRYLKGSGIDDGLIETQVFGKVTLNSVLEGNHYVRSFHGLMMVSDTLNSLAWEAFWEWLKLNNRSTSDQFMDQAHDVQQALYAKVRSTQKFENLLDQSLDLQEQFKCFLEECCAKSEVCQYFQVFQWMVAIIKHAVASDREGNFQLHLAVVQASLPIFRESDCINYLRYGMFYLESTKALEATHPDVFQQFMCGKFVVKDRADGYFNAVSPDMKLEQSIQRASKSSGGIVGKTRSLSAMFEWQLIFHEILLISNNLRDIVNDTSMKHSESTRVHHELTGSRAQKLNENVSKLLDFLRDRGNPYIINVPLIKLHHTVTKQLVFDEVAVRLLQMQKKGDELVRAFRIERFVEKTKKLSSTISKRRLPQFDSKPDTEANVSSVATSKSIALAHRNIEIVRERGMELESIYAHDILPVSTLFDGDLPTKPQKSELITDLEKNLKDNDYCFPGGTVPVILDFMSKIRSFSNLQSFGTFGHALKCVLSAGHSICSRSSLHIVFDSYLESSVKGGERLRRTCGVNSVDLTELCADVPIPQQMQKFWNSSVNKVMLQGLVRDLVVSTELVNLDVVLGGCVTDEGVVPAEFLPSGRPTSPSETKETIEALTCDAEEADDRIIMHCAWEVDQGSSRLLVVSNDTDTVTRLLHFIHHLQKKGLRELWVEFGTGERRRYIPIHTLADKLGEGLSKVIVKAHILTGDDALSKIGTKHAALSCNPEHYLSNFAQSSMLTDENFTEAEKYLVRVWAGAKSKSESKTFDQLRVEVQLRATTPKSLDALPPTSSAIHSHIRRAFYCIRKVLCLLDVTQPDIDPTRYGWMKDNDTLLPEKGLNPLPPKMLFVCKCRGKCDSARCLCKKSGAKCVVFCHMEQSTCQNK